MGSQTWPLTAPGPPECHPESSMNCIVLHYFTLHCIITLAHHCTLHCNAMLPGATQSHWIVLHCIAMLSATHSHPISVLHCISIMHWHFIAMQILHYALKTWCHPATNILHYNALYFFALHCSSSTPTVFHLNNKLESSRPQLIFHCHISFQLAASIAPSISWLHPECCLPQCVSLCCTFKLKFNKLANGIMASNSLMMYPSSQ